MKRKVLLFIMLFLCMSVIIIQSYIWNVKTKLDAFIDVKQIVDNSIWDPDGIVVDRIEKWNDILMQIKNHKANHLFILNLDKYKRIKLRDTPHINKEYWVETYQNR